MTINPRHRRRPPVAPAPSHVCALLAIWSASCTSFSTQPTLSSFRISGPRPTAKASGVRVSTRRYADAFYNPKKEAADEEISLVAIDDSDAGRRKRRDKLARKRRAVTVLEEEERDEQDRLFIALAVIPSFVAFLSWEGISFGVAEFVDMFGAMGKAVDGGQFSNNLLRPTITGVVVPVISIALATLVSTTVNVLRARQVELRSLVNKEACELRLLRRAVFGMFGTRQHAGRRARALALLAGYVEELERESSAGAVDALEELQLSGGIAKNELDRLAAMMHGVDGAAASRQGSVGAAEDLILSLNGHRSDRVALLLSVFPTIHWGVLVALSLSVVMAFLLVSNQQLLKYLNSVQLRACFAVLVGVLSGTWALCLDLADVFRGSFSITEASTQLGDLRICLKEDVREACTEAGDISSTTRTFIDALLSGPTDTGDFLVYNGYLERKRRLDDELEKKNEVGQKGGDGTNRVIGGSTGSSLKHAIRNGKGRSLGGSSPTRYGLISTLYFHLLTGPLGSKVRVLGDVIAWTASFVASKTKSLFGRLKRLWQRDGKDTSSVSAK